MLYGRGQFLPVPRMVGLRRTALFPSPPRSREVTHRHGQHSFRGRPARLLANPPLRKNPLTATAIGSAGIILRSSTSCSVTRYLPRTASFMHCAASILRAWLRRIVWWGARVNEDAGHTCRELLPW